MATATRPAVGARSAAPRTGTRQRPAPKRAPLRVVEQRQRRIRVGIFAIGIVTAIMFAIVVAQTMVISQQGHIDSLNRRIAQAEGRAEDLRVELAALQSPQHVTTEAANRLGMIAAPTPLYLLPKANDDERAAEVPPISKPKVTTPAPSATTPNTTAKAAR